MTITSSRVAAEDDASVIAEIVNSHELSVDPANSVMSVDSALEFMAGYIDPSPTHLLSIDGESDFSAVVNLHPDAVKGRFFADVYAKPEVKNLTEVTAWAIDLATAHNSEWAIWPGVNSLDERLKSAWAAHGFEFLRRYYTMRASTSKAISIRSIDEIEIRSIDISDPVIQTHLHHIHQDSFSNHFGFAPRTFEEWHKLLEKDHLIDRQGVFIAYQGGEAVGFVQCGDDYADERKGFISTLGVMKTHQGSGIGQALLQTAMMHSASKGYGVVELNVDTGNESGALKLYEKLGFKAESSWIQMHQIKDGWSAI